MHAEQAGRLLPGTFNYYALSADGRHYLPFGDRIVVASRLQFGNIDARRQRWARNVPFSKKYFLGGATSVAAGDATRSARSADPGLPIGGNSMLAFSAELRAMLRGQARRRAVPRRRQRVGRRVGHRPRRSSRTRSGAGLRYQTPVGPIRFDFGYQLNPIEGLLVNGEPQKRRWRIHFSIGQAF